MWARAGEDQAGIVGRETGERSTRIESRAKILLSRLRPHLPRRNAEICSTGSADRRDRTDPATPSRPLRQATAHRCRSAGLETKPSGRRMTKPPLGSGSGTPPKSRRASLPSPVSTSSAPSECPPAMPATSPSARWSRTRGIMRRWRRSRVYRCRRQRDIGERQRGCHFYFARPVTFLSCADNSEAA